MAGNFICIKDSVFIDPACGSGNFLTESYLALRRLENQVILQRQILGTETSDTKTPIQISFADLSHKESNPIKVSITQFSGIEINDFAVTVARTALWIAENQMLKETEDIIHTKLNFLPLKTAANIVEGNALRINWEDVVPKEKLNFIMGNPPFVGARWMSKEQKEDVKNTFYGWKNIGDLDYVCCWYKKASDFMKNTKINAALVSTNSISQGMSVSLLWKPLIEDGLSINFAYPAFPWDSEAKIKARVHVVIIGFSKYNNGREKALFYGDKKKTTEHINGYLTDSGDVFIENRSTPLCSVPTIAMGNQPIDNGNYLFSADEMRAFISVEPRSEKWFKPWYGAQEFINQKPRYCLWLGNCPPNELKKCLLVSNALRL